MDYLADLADLDEVLWRIGRHDQNIGVRLDEDSGFAFVSLAQVIAGTQSFCDAGFEVGGFADAFAVAADAAIVGQPVGFALD